MISIKLQESTGCQHCNFYLIYNLMLHHHHVQFTSICHASLGRQIYFIANFYVNEILPSCVSEAKFITESPS